MSHSNTHARGLSALALLILSSACSSDEVTRAVPTLPDGATRQIQGTLTIGVVQGDRVQFVTKDEPWSATARVRDGVLSTGNEATHGLPSAPRALLVDDDATLGAAAAPPILALRANHALARGRPGESYATSYTANGHEYTVAVLHGTAGGPAERVVFFEDGKAVHTARYEWERTGDSWAVRTVVLSTWHDGRPTGLVVSRVSGEATSLASERPSAAALVTDASSSILDAVAFVADRYLLPTKASAQLKKMYFTECAPQWLAVGGFGLQLAFALHPASGVIEKAKVVPLAYSLLGAYSVLALCISDHRKQDMQQETQRIAGEVVTAPDEPLAWEDMTPEVQQALHDLLAYCETDPSILVCQQFVVPY